MKYYFNISELNQRRMRQKTELYEKKNFLLPQTITTS